MHTTPKFGYAQHHQTAASTTIQTLWSKMCCCVPVTTGDQHEISFYFADNLPCRYWTVDPKGDKMEALAVPTALQEALVSHSASLALASGLFTLLAPLQVSLLHHAYITQLKRREDVCTVGHV